MTNGLVMVGPVGSWLAEKIQSQRVVSSVFFFYGSGVSKTNEWLFTRENDDQPRDLGYPIFRQSHISMCNNGLIVMNRTVNRILILDCQRVKLVIAC
jgi:hypothetical protein